jgi:type II secretory pathway pseudopilin PulG
MMHPLRMTCSRRRPLACPHSRILPAAPVAVCRGYTLVEIVLVLCIVAIALGMVGSLVGPRVVRGNQVKGAADQLASVLRRVRQMAMDHRALFGVSFNIQNAPGSSGAVLNNRSGGHWYRIIGPHDPGSGSWSGAGGYDMPLLFDHASWCSNNGSTPAGDVELGWWLADIQRDFIGGRYVLPKGQARFLALTDEDNGNYCTYYSKFGPTYPRPWFGEFIVGPGDSQARLYAWGGYEAGNQQFLDNFSSGVGWRPTRPTVNYSGFYYQGNDPEVVGCVNPRDRWIVDDPQGTRAVVDPDGAQQAPGEGYRLLAKGDGRALINGDWLDCVILFNPDGTATMADWMGMRHGYGSDGGGTSWWNDAVHHNLMQLGPGDMCNFTTPWQAYSAMVPYNTRYEASSYVKATGTYYITIGGDAPDDTVKFPSSEAALASLLPLYRVAISRLGEIKVVEVRTTTPAGVVLDPSWSLGRYQTYGIATKGFYNNLAVSTTGVPLMPAEDFVTSAMMAGQQWWIDP